MGVKANRFKKQLGKLLNQKVCLDHPKEECSGAAVTKGWVS